MIAFDTNLLIRLAVNDDQYQAEIAEQLLQSNQVFLSRTVLLETEWVLRSCYKNSSENIAQFMQALLDNENILIENADSVALAINWYHLGADFADALHLSTSGTANFYTFDQSFCKKARDLHLTPEINILKKNYSQK